MHVEMWRGKGVGNIHMTGFLDPVWNEVCDHNPWCEYSVAEIVLEGSSYTHCHIIRLLAGIKSRLKKALQRVILAE